MYRDTASAACMVSPSSCSRLTQVALFGKKVTALGLRGLAESDAFAACFEIYQDFRDTPELSARGLLRESSLLTWRG